MNRGRAPKGHTSATQRSAHRKTRAPAKRGSRAPASRSGGDQPQDAAAAIAEAAAELARALPELVRHALTRARKGKPVSLLRSVRGLLRELEQIIPPTKRPPHPQLGVLTDWELELCRQLVTHIRAAHADPETAIAEDATPTETAAPSVSTIPLETAPEKV